MRTDIIMFILFRSHVRVGSEKITDCVFVGKDLAKLISQIEPLECL